MCNDLFLVFTQEYVCFVLMRFFLFVLGGGVVVLRDREKERQKERERESEQCDRNIDQLPPMHTYTPQPSTKPATWVNALTWNLTHDLSVYTN